MEEAWRAAVHGSQRVEHNVSTEQQHGILLENQLCQAPGILTGTMNSSHSTEKNQEERGCDLS